MLDVLEKKRPLTEQGHSERRMASPNPEAMNRKT
jgi:hypothetical protein